jgi:transmembrane sensor
MTEFPDTNDEAPLEEKAHRIAALIAGYIHTGLTAAEHNELDEWVGESDENMRLFEELTDERTAQHALDWLRDADGPRMLKKIKGQLSFNPPRRRSFFSHFWYAIAASVVIILGFYWYKNSGKSTVVPSVPVAAATQDLQPGRDKAILTLDDGKSIVLDEARDGTLATQGNTEINKKNGQLLYTSNGTSNTLGPKYNTVLTPRGGSYPLTLSDGTRIWLNAASSIRFPAVFNENERKVTITGEAYFEVAKNSKKPFKVEVKDKGLIVEVLGTHFNINAYDDETSVKTTLLEGSVKLNTGDKSKFLKPGQQGQLGDAGNIKMVSDADIMEAVAWKDGFFKFNNTDLKTIMRLASRWYDVEIEYKTNQNPSYTSLLSRNKPASVLFETLEASGGIHFKVDGKKIIVLP